MRIENYTIEKECKENDFLHVRGNVYGYDRLKDGTMITTSRIRAIDNNVIITEMGNWFVLGRKLKKGGDRDD